MKKKKLISTLMFIVITIIAIILILNISKNDKQKTESGKPIDYEIEGIVNKDAIFEPTNERGEITTEDLENVLNQLK